MFVLTNDELQDRIQDTMANVNAFALPSVANTLAICFYTGVRTNEANDRTNWEDNGGGIYTVKLSKRNPPRIINCPEIVPIIQPWFDDKAETFGVFSDETLRRVFKECSPGIMYRGKEELLVHAFRYNYIRQLYENGQSETQIQATMCISKLQTVQGYLFNPILYR